MIIKEDEDKFIALVKLMKTAKGGININTFLTQYYTLDKQLADHFYRLLKNEKLADNASEPCSLKLNYTGEKTTEKDFKKLFKSGTLKKEKPEYLKLDWYIEKVISQVLGLIVGAIVGLVVGFLVGKGI